MNSRLSLGYTIIFVLLIIPTGWSEVYLDYQSNDRPFGLDIIDEVQQAGSDDDAADFMNNHLPAMRDIINENLSERMALPANVVDSMALDPTKLSLSEESDIRVYFVAEGAGYHNTLGFNTEGGGVTGGSPQLIFPDSSSYNSYFLNGDETLGYRSESYPVLPGDFVELGTFGAGTNLDFFLIGNGANGGTHVYSTDESVNPDGIPHVVSFGLENTSFILIGFEDLYGGGDRDFNDLLFAVDIGAANVEQLIQTVALVPEAHEVIMLAIVFCFIVVMIKKKEGQHLLVS